MKMSRVQTKPDVRNEHTLFCPVYTLNKKLQAGSGMILKWNPWTHAGVYLGISPEYSSEVALVLNLSTGHVSPQCHVVIDDQFTTVDYIQSWRQPEN